VESLRVALSETIKVSPSDEYSVPRKMREKHENIAAITDELCREHLNEDRVPGIVTA
jgi:hypothetical protein